MRIGTTVIALLAASAAACGGDSGAPTAEENRELDAAEAMLDDAPNSLSEVENDALAENGADDAAP